MECDLTLNGIDVVITTNQDETSTNQLASNSEESSSTSSTVNTPNENVNRSFAKSLISSNFDAINCINESSIINKNDENKSINYDTAQTKNSDVKSLVSNSSQSTLTDHTDSKENNNFNKEPFNNLPWNSSKKDRIAPSNLPIDKNIRPGEFVLRTLFSEFAILAEKKIDAVLTQEAADKPLSKLQLQRGEDPIFDQLLSAFGSVAEHCLPSLLKTLFAWYERQLNATQSIIEQQKNQQHKDDGSQSKATGKTIQHESTEKNEMIYLLEKRDLCIEFIFCLFLIEVLKQLPLHPGHDELILYIESIAFKHFKHTERSQNDPNIQNFNIVADLYAEVIGVLAQSRFQSVRNHFITELNELRSKEASAFNTYSIISLLMGMKFFRIKMVPIQEFEQSFQFMTECGHYFLEVKDKDIKHTLAGLLVEILLPVAATVKTEVNITCLKNFVEMLFSPTLDLCTKKKHMLAICPLVTCLLCVSQKQFFIQNWHYFLAICLSHLKNRDTKISRVALESLYRLLWVYMIRIKCESNTATQSKLHSIVNSLFPKGSKSVVPRDTPLNIFVKIIQFIAQERLDFAMKEIVFDLLSVGRHFKIIMTPERMSIGLRAFLVVADNLQQKEGEPPMPRTSVLPSGNAQRVKKTYLNKLLTDQMAKSIGMDAYYPHVKKVLNDILKALDGQLGKPLMKTITQNINKEFDEMITAERKPKIDLFRTCIAAIPRLMPEIMAKQQLIELLARLTIHIDDELSGLAFQSLQNIINDFEDWREEVIDHFITFILHEVNDTFVQLLDNSLRILLQLLTNWKSSVQQMHKQSKQSQQLTENRNENTIPSLHKAEAFSIVMLCSYRQNTRRLSALILKECRSLLLLFAKKNDDKPVLDVIDKICPQVVENCLNYISANERSTLQSISFNVDLQWLADRTSASWISDVMTDNDSICSKLSINDEEPKINAWLACLMEFLTEISNHCTMTTYYAWYYTYQRMNGLFLLIETNVLNDTNRASVLLRGATSTLKKTPSEKDIHLSLWKNYLMLVCRIAPSSSSLIHRTFPHELSSSPDSISSERSLENKSPLNRGINASQLFKTVLPFIRSDQTYLRLATVLGLSYVNSNAIKELMDELIPFLKEAVDRKQENMRRRKRRDILRLQLGKLLCMIAERDTFGNSKMMIDSNTGFLCSIFVEYIEGCWFFLENEGNKDIDPQIREIKQQFCSFVTKLIKSFNVENRTNLLSKDLRRNLFYLFASFSGHVTASLFRSSSMISKHRKDKEENKLNDLTEFNFVALQAMCSVLCCGTVFADHCLIEESSYFDWLFMILNSTDERLRNVGQETVILLLEFNPDEGSLLDWLVECCFTKSAQVADICFKAIATIFSIREYPCDHYISIINVTLLNVGSPKSNIQQLALQLLHQLDSRFFDSKSVFHQEKVPSMNQDNFNLDEEHLDEFDTHKTLSNNKSDDGLDDQQSPFKFRHKNDECQRSSFEPLLDNLFPANQTEVSKRMSILHPEITMAIFSEITHRFQTARPSVCQNMLTYLIPWLYNMELVDTHLSTIAHGNAPPSIVENLNSNNNQEGWGSVEATEMVLNNLFYITVKFGDLYAKEIEDLWIALSSNWLNNMRIIIRYLFIITGLSPTELLPYSKRVAIFMAHAKPERLIDELMFELQTVESLNCIIERMETPPFYRITNTRKCSSHSDEEEITLAANDQQLNTNTVIKVEQGTLHTKRHSTESSERLLNENLFDPSNQQLTTKSEIYTSSTLKESLILLSRATTINDNYKPNTPQPHPLPMPEYGGFYAPLTEYLPDSSQPIIGFHRCNLALMLLTDIVLDGIQIDLTAHVPLMIHIIFLGFDHPKSLVHEHCKALFINLLLVLTKQKNLLNVFKIIVNNQTRQLNYGLVLNNFLNDQVPNFIDPPTSKNVPKIMSTASSRKSSLGRSKNIYFDYKSDINLDDNASTTNTDKQYESFLIDLKNKDNLETLMAYLIHFMSSRPIKQLWNYEDITAKVWHVRSADQISYFLQFVLEALKESLPSAHIAERWAEISLQLALSCSSRHYAGRSLQIFRAIKMPINSRILSDILSRLVETVAEQGEDMQGYVTELMLTLESSVETLNSDQRIISDFVRDFFKSTPNLMNKELNRKSAPPLGTNTYNILKNNPNQNLDYRNNADRMFANRTYHYHPSQNYQIRHRSNTDSDMKLNHSNLPRMNNMNTNNNNANIINLNRSRSVQSLKNQEQAYLTPEDRNSLLVQFFMISVAMLETDYEHEFLLALRLMDKVLNNLQLDSKDCQEKIEKILIQSKWSKFQGVHTMLLKGVTSTTTYEPTIMLLHRLTLYLELPIIDPSESINSFPFNVMALLPYMLLHYNEPNSLCTKAAEQIAQWCTEKSTKLDNLATVMTLYSKRSFSKECFQWTKCVVKYLYDAYSHAFLGIINFLTEVSDKGSSNLTSHIMSILHCILDYVDITSIPPISINNDLSKIISKYEGTQGQQWKDCLKILKHIVTRSSTLAAPPSNSSTIISSGMNSVSSSINYPSISDCLIVSSVPFTDSSSKHELPGRTIEFSFDTNQTPIVGRKFIDKKEIDKKTEITTTTTTTTTETVTTPTTTITTNPTNEQQISACSPRRSLSYTHSFNENSSNWRRPWSCQSRVRDKLIGLLTSFGQRVNLHKSPSVIFSQTSDIIDRQSSLASSTEEISAANNEISSESKIEDSNPDQFGLFKEFDFLEYELGSQEEESIDNFNWGVRRPIDQHDLEQQDVFDQLDQLDRLGSPLPHQLRKDLDLKSDLSSDEEGSASSSPLFNSINYTNELVQELNPFINTNNQNKTNQYSSSPSSVSSLSSTSSTILKD